MVKIKWFIYTVLVGLIPWFVRTSIFLFDKTATLKYWINEFDFIVLGLVLNLGNINQLDVNSTNEVNWKSKMIGFSVLTLVLLSSIYAIVSYADFKQNQDIDKFTVKCCTFVIMLVSLIFSYSILDKLKDEI